MQKNNIYQSTAGIVFLSTPIELINHNKQVFTYFQKNITGLKKNYYNSENYKYFIKLVTLNTKCGFKLKAFKFFCAANVEIYKNFNEFNSSLYEKHPTYKNFYEFSKMFAEEFYKSDFFIKYIFIYLELLYLIKKIKPKKKKKKKNQLKN